MKKTVTQVKAEVRELEAKLATSKRMTYKQYTAAMLAIRVAAAQSVRLVDHRRNAPKETE